jgi:hypothetical protein
VSWHYDPTGIALQLSGRVLIVLCGVLSLGPNFGTVTFCLFSRALHSGVSVGNGLDAEGAKALGDALKDNTTLTSLLLELRSE